MVDTINIRPPLWLPIIVVLIGGAFYIQGKSIEVGTAGMHEPVVISVSADAKVSGAPDIATLNFGVQTGRQPTAKAAIAKVSKDMAAVLAAVKKMGVEEKDITTQSFWLSPVYDYNEGKQIPRGYEANQSLRVKVRDLDKVGDVLTAATDAGANQAGSISFEIDNPDALTAQAREMAIEKAKSKADVLAASLGMQVARLTDFSEGGNGYYPPMAMMNKTMDYGVGDAMAEQSAQLPAGEQEIQSTVTLMYELR